MDLTESKADLARANAAATGFRRDLTVDVVRDALVRHQGSYALAVEELSTSVETLRRRVPAGTVAPRGSGAVRSRTDITVDVAVAAMEEHGSVKAAAEELGCSTNVVKDRLVMGGRTDLIRPRIIVPRAVVVRQETAAEDDWRKRSACRTEDPELFFPISETSGPGLLQVAEAKRVCAGCDVQRECLTRHMDEPDGVFAGLTSRERQNARRRMARAAGGQS